VQAGRSSLARLGSARPQLSVSKYSCTKTGSIILLSPFLSFFFAFPSMSVYAVVVPYSFARESTYGTPPVRDNSRSLR
jgi:hypothetical protein